jgi:hypothetical protein
MEFSKICKVNGETTHPGNVLKKPGFVSGHGFYVYGGAKISKKLSSKAFHHQL